MVGKDAQRGYGARTDLADWADLHSVRSPEQAERDEVFNGVEAFADWIGQQGKRTWGSWDMAPTLAQQLITRCHQLHMDFLHSIGLDDPTLAPDSYEYSVRSAQDFILSTMFASSPARVIDFGAGYGRNAFLIADYPDAVYCGIDSIEKNYCAQTLLLKFVYPEGAVFEYLDDPNADRAAVQKFVQRGGAVHIPTWRLDLLPVEKFNILIMSHVFHELSESAAWAVLDDIVGKMPSRSVVYFRGNLRTRNHSMDMEKELKARGFSRLVELNRRNYDPSVTGAAGRIIIYAKDDVANVPMWKRTGRTLNRLSGGSVGRLDKALRR